MLLVGGGGQGQGITHQLQGGMGGGGGVGGMGGMGGGGVGGMGAHHATGGQACPPCGGDVGGMQQGKGACYQDQGRYHDQDQGRYHCDQGRGFSYHDQGKGQSQGAYYHNQGQGSRFQDPRCQPHPVIPTALSGMMPADHIVGGMGGHHGFMTMGGGCSNCNCSICNMQIDMTAAAVPKSAVMRNNGQNAPQTPPLMRVPPMTAPRPPQGPPPSHLVVRPVVNPISDQGAATAKAPVQASPYMYLLAFGISRHRAWVGLWV